MDNFPPSLLAVFAHPDDESFSMGGALARYAAEGHPVTLVCATRGEVGEISNFSLATPETLGYMHERELRAATRALGVQNVILLDYRDSGMDGAPENQDRRTFINASETEVVGRLTRIIRDMQPEVVVIFEPGGGLSSDLFACWEAESVTESSHPNTGGGAEHLTAAVLFVGLIWRHPGVIPQCIINQVKQSA